MSGFTWCRLDNGTYSDPKWGVIARRCGQPVGTVIAIWTAMLNVASAASKRGTLESWSDEDVAYALGYETDVVVAVRTAMQGKVLDGDMLPGWEKRQPKKEDSTAAQRKRAQRDKQRDKRDDDDGHAASRQVTPGHDTEHNRTVQSSGSNEPDAEPASQVDPIKTIFDRGCEILAELGIPESQRRGLVGKARMACGNDDGLTIALLAQLRVEKPVDPGGWIQARIRRKPTAQSPPGKGGYVPMHPGAGG